MGLGALLILISSYQLFFKTSDNASGLKLGTLTSTLSVVKTKNALALDWRDASTGNDLTENQLIYTDSASSAEVLFTEGSALEIGENSLVKLKSADKEHSMDLSKGFIRAKLEGNRPLKVQMNGEDYLVSGNNADIQINLEDQKGEIGVLTGEIKVEKDGLSESLNPESALEISGESFKKKIIYFKGLKPLKSEVKYVLNSPTPVMFEWEPVEEAKVIISKKSTLERPITAQGGGTSSVNLSTGLYYFRIESEKGSSLLSSFKIVREGPPQLIRPLDGEEISVLEGEDQLLLQWRNPERLNYSLEWDDGELHSLQAGGESTVVKIIKGRPFKWRLKIDSEKRPDAVWSEWQEVNVTFVPHPETPVDLIPSGVEFQTYEKPNEKITLSWKSEFSNEIEIQDPAGNVSSQKVKGDSFDYIARLAGDYSWRVRAVDSHLRSSEWTEWETFKIEDLSDQKNAEGIQRVQLEKPDQRITFNWEAEEGTVSVFELAKDSGFKTVVKKVEVSKTEVQVSVPEVGAYYWRSRQYLPDGTFQISEPRRVIIEPTPAPQKPEKLPDLEVPLEEFPIKTTLLETVFNLLISSAYADEVKGVVRLVLPVKEEAKSYIVRIYKDKNLSQLIYEEQLTGKDFVWKNAEAGVYYWQYAVIDYWDRTSLFSDPARLTIKSEDVPAPVKPRLLSPIRAVEIDGQELVFKWRHSDFNMNYQIEISEKRNFKKILLQKKSSKNEATFTHPKLTSKLHFWRVRAFNKRGEEVLSNTGRFIIKPQLEKLIIADQFPTPWKKDWKSRSFLAWVPSMDSYTFEDGETGKIDGTAMMGAQLSGTIFKEKWIFNGELLRQTGKVFEGESYLFQRILLDAVKTLNTNHHHKLALGMVIGQSSGQAYDIGTDNVVTAESVSGPSYGPIFRNYLALNKKWEMQGKLLYLLGDIKQMEIGADLIRQQASYMLLGGVGYTSREYEINSGKQSSIKISLGIGKEF